MTALDVHRLTQLSGISLPLYVDDDGYVVVLLVSTSPGTARFTRERFNNVDEAIDFCEKETGPRARLKREPIPLDLWEGPRTWQGVVAPGSDDVIEHKPKRKYWY